MKIDVHFHVAGNGRDIGNADNDIYFVPEDNHYWFTRITHSILMEELEKLGADFNRDGTISTDEYFELAYSVLTASEEIDGAVLLAMDAVFDPDSGGIDEIKTDLYVTNKFLHQKVTELNDRLQNETDPGKRSKRFFLGASISPNRKDWEMELEYVLAQTGAVLIKWIPSAQHIDLADARHKDFYSALATNGMPLLCHVGPEYTFPEGRRERKRDYFELLEYPLAEGVTVVAAHCATPVFPIVDRNDTAKFLDFMKAANADGLKLWADTSALSMSTRILVIPEIVHDFPPEWLVHGSDFPLPFDAWPHLPWVTHDVTPEEYLQIKKTKNPLDRDVRIKRAHGFPDSILDNTEAVLRLV